MDKIARDIVVVEHPRGGYQIRVGADAMDEAMPVFEAAGSYGNGPAWGVLIEYVVSHDARLSDYTLDPEGLGWSESRDPLERLRTALLEAVSDAKSLESIVQKARGAGFGHGDL